jgi:hypothetical protein
MPAGLEFWIEEFMVCGCCRVWLGSVAGTFRRVPADFSLWKSLARSTTERMPEDLLGCYGEFPP